MMEKKEDQTFKRSKFLINGIGIKYCDLFYESPAKDRSRGRGFEISIEAKRMDMSLGNVEYIELFFDDKMIAAGWTIVQREHMHYWKFTEVVSYSPWWPGVEKWAESMQRE